MSRIQQRIKCGQYLGREVNSSFEGYLIEKSRFFSSIQELGQNHLKGHSILDNREISSIYSFPNDFKIRANLPFLVIFLYPCYMIRL